MNERVPLHCKPSSKVISYNHLSREYNDCIRVHLQRGERKSCKTKMLYSPLLSLPLVKCCINMLILYPFFVHNACAAGQRSI